MYVRKCQTSTATPRQSWGIFQRISRRGVVRLTRQTCQNQRNLWKWNRRLKLPLLAPVASICCGPTLIEHKDKTQFVTLNDSNSPT